MVDFSSLSREELELLLMSMRKELDDTRSELLGAKTELENTKDELGAAK